MTESLYYLKYCLPVVQLVSFAGSGNVAATNDISYLNYLLSYPGNLSSYSPAKNLRFMLN